MQISLNKVWRVAESFAADWSVPNLYLAETRIFFACVKWPQLQKKFEMTQVFMVVNLPFEFANCLKHVCKRELLPASIQAAEFFGSLATFLEGAKAIDLPIKGLENWIGHFYFYNAVLSLSKIIKNNQDGSSFSSEDVSTLIISITSSLFFFKKSSQFILWLLFIGVGYYIVDDLAARARKASKHLPVPGSPAAQWTRDAYDKTLSAYPEQTRQLSPSEIKARQEKIKEQLLSSTTIREKTSTYLSQVSSLRMKNATGGAFETKKVDEIAGALTAQVFNIGIQLGRDMEQVAKRYFENRDLSINLGTARKAVDVTVNTDGTTLIQHYLVIPIINGKVGENLGSIDLRLVVNVDKEEKNFTVTESVKKIEKDDSTLDAHLTAALLPNSGTA